MSSKAGRLKKGEDRTDINISPMIDMVFILLIFFIVTTVFVDERGLGVDKPTPQPEQPQETETDPIMFRITATGQIIHDDVNIPLSRVESITRVVRSQADVPVILQVERAARSGLMIQVMDSARRADPDIKVTVTAVD